MTTQSFPRPLPPSAWVAAVLSVLVVGCAADGLNSDAREISEAESKLVFADSEFEGGFRRFVSEKTSNGAEWVVGVYGPVSGRLPRAEIVFYRPPPRYFLSHPAATGDIAERFEFFSGRALYFGQSGSAENRIGTANYQILTADNIPCVIFELPFGSRQHGFAGDRTLFGFYCREPAQQLGVPQAERIIAAFGHADYGAPEPAGGDGSRTRAAAATEVPVTVDWEGRGNAIGGTIAVIASTTAGEFRLRLDDGTACAGTWTRLSGAYGTDAPPSGEWKMVCDNGLSAAGTYVSSAEGAGAFTGTDQGRRAVRLRYGAA